MAERDERRTLRVAAAQFDALGGDIEANVETHVRMIESAGDRGVELLVFPELSLTGYASQTLDRSPQSCIIDPSGQALEPLRSACRQRGVAAVVGGSLRRDRGMALSALVIDRQGQVGATYDKQHLDGPEKDWFVPGAEGSMIDLDGWRMGLGICYDASFPEHGRGLALEGADLYLVSGAFPLGASDRRRSIYMPARALENTVYVAFANYIGAHQGLAYCGHSAVIAPDGRLLADAGPDQPGLAVADLDPAALRETRETLRMLDERPTGAPASRVTALV